MTPLNDLLQQLAEDDARSVPSPMLRLRVMRSWRDHHRPFHRWLWLPAAAAVVLGALAWNRPDTQQQPEEPTESLSVVRVRMPRSALVNFGLSLPDPHADGLVDVEVIVGEDGIPRSINRVALASAPLEESRR